MSWLKKNKQEANDEKRRCERLRPEDIFLVEFQGTSLKKARLGQGKDISERGIRSATSAGLKKGQRLDLTVYFPKKFPGPGKEEVKALVHRVHDPGGSHRLRVACEFFEKSPRVDETLAAYLYWAAPQG